MKQNTDQPKFYFAGDLHFLHNQIFIYKKRGFETIEEMNEAIINNFNKVVRPQDYLIILGDVFLGNKTKAKELISRLVGHKTLVRGNHDMSTRQCLGMGFEWVCQSMTLNIQGTTILLSHYPYRYNFLKKWYKLAKNYLRGRRVDQRDFDQAPKDHGMILVHAHTHQKDKVRGRQICVSLDAWNNKPVSEDQLASLINRINCGK
jgi:calcineurin-like phosphoesterase family protein